MLNEAHSLSSLELLSSKSLSDADPLGDYFAESALAWVVTRGRPVRSLSSQLKSIAKILLIYCCPTSAK